MKKQLALAWFRFTSYFQWTRVAGIAALSLVAYLLLFFVFGNINVGWLFPAAPRRFHWPQLPPFAVQTETAPDGHSRETLYTVPSRQITPQELAQLEATNRAAPK